MLYFPLFDFYWPEWVPIKGGEYFEFFSPVFNIADSSIFIGVATILISQKKFFAEQFEEASETSTQTEAVASEQNPDSTMVITTEEPVAADETPDQPKEEIKPDSPTS
jgi:signal peptidase II